MKVVSVVGARPQFVKLAPIAEAFGQGPDEHVIVHTGQHYDARMSDVFFADLEIPAPDVHLGVGSGSHGRQTGSMLSAMDEVLEEHRPDWVLVYGDTNSTIAGALSAVKLHIPVAHLEAGLRSFNRAMPEEHNRVLTDHAADLLLAPTEVAMGHLRDEGLATRSVLVGDVMTDVCYRVRDAVKDQSPYLPDPLVPGEYVVATVHRAENTDDPARLAAIVEALAATASPVLLLAHPRLRARCQEYGIRVDGHPGLHVTQPLPYPEMVRAIIHSAGVVTDSGGLQKEAFLLGKPCTTLRTETEWVETLTNEWNVLLPGLDGLSKLADRPAPTSAQGAPYGKGEAAAAVLEALGANQS
ncbi:UDP-N-acetylglucosamine 2-epimerase (non-hydrolyzing) [Ruania alkalisoli]|uniref:UDP-N-acetylglucosamine 2-epimerase (Non-hydrolyzing) n=1 Tax=Ruania alkalisoli TaxID=2779775 RepID=A0A7M1ST20_9MICO|nr:UDP-N-acetylglucosamine 2-epimerase (non-hydrolyzing) [Ruania alkalisoli]QOR69763.1 UDP-N-acetylglucosamine 2-epimerase (non-hydrolyzing) [Ruania alkalisoli]